MYKLQTLTCLALFFITADVLYGGDLLNAIEKSDLKGVEAIISKDPESVNTEIAKKGFPLSVAVSELEVDIVKLLLDNKADVKDADSKTKENVAFRLLDKSQTANNLKKAIEILALLSEHKTNFNMINVENMTPLYKYCVGRQPFNPLDIKLEFLQALITAGAKVDIKLNRDEPLLNAVLMKVLKATPEHIPVAKLLINNGVPLNEKTKKNAECKAKNSVVENDTPLLIVVKREGFQTLEKSYMIKLLIENGAKNIANKKKETPKRLIKRKSPYYDALYKTKKKRKR